MGLFTRDSAPEPVSYDAPRPLRASAQVISMDTRKEVDAFSRTVGKAKRSDSWQSAAWDYFDEVGEVKYAFYVMANTISRIRVYPGIVVDPARPPQPVNDIDPATLPEGLVEGISKAMRKLSSGPGGIPTLLRDLALNLCVPGEGYLVQIPERRGTGKAESWAIYSADAVMVDANGKISLKLSPDDKVDDYILLPEKAFVGRIWRSHPRYANEPDSSMRGLLGLLEELMLLNRSVRATARSRLNAGMIYLPDGLSTTRSEATPYTDDLDATAGADPALAAPGDEDDEFEIEFMTSLVTPIQNEDSASAVVPLIVRGPADLGEKIKVFKFERSFDPALSARADKVLDRILAGLDIPKEVVKGLADVKYSNAVVIDDQFFRSNVEPLILMICDALTTVYLRQYLKALDFTEDQIHSVVLWYDPADVVVRPNRNEDATQGFDRYAISADAWRRTHGFSETDAPDEDEVLKRLVISKGQIPDALTEALLRVIAPELMAAARAANPDVNSNLPPEVQQALGTPPSEAPVPTTAPPPSAVQDAQPTPEPTVPVPPNARPRQPDEPITAPPSPPTAGNPAA